MFGTKNLAQLVQAHPGSTEVDRMYDIHDSPMWKDVFSPQGTFLGVKRNISLGLCTDGVNPFSHHHISYSMWPIMLSILNFPQHLRLDFGNILLVGIIPGNGSKKPQTLSPYLEVVVDELPSLANVKMFDAYKQASFHLKIDLLLYIFDYPGIGKVFNITGSGAYKGCAWCEIKGI